MSKTDNIPNREAEPVPSKRKELTGRAKWLAMQNEVRQDPEFLDSIERTLLSMIVKGEENRKGKKKPITSFPSKFHDIYQRWMAVKQKFDQYRVDVDGKKIDFGVMNETLDALAPRLLNRYKSNRPNFEKPEEVEKYHKVRDLDQILVKQFNIYKRRFKEQAETGAQVDLSEFKKYIGKKFQDFYFALGRVKGVINNHENGAKERAKELEEKISGINIPVYDDSGLKTKIDSLKQVLEDLKNRPVYDAEETRKILAKLSEMESNVKEQYDRLAELVKQRPTGGYDPKELAEALKGAIKIENIGNPKTELPAGYSGSNDSDLGKKIDELKEEFEKYKKSNAKVLQKFATAVDERFNKNENKDNAAEDETPSENPSEVPEQRHDKNTQSEKQPVKKQESSPKKTKESPKPEEEEKKYELGETGVLPYLNAKKQMENMIEGMTLDLMQIYSTVGKEILQVKGDIRQYDMSKLRDNEIRTLYKTALNAKVLDAAKEKMFIDKVKDDGHAESIMYGWFGFNQAATEGVIEQEKNEFHLDHLLKMIEERVKAKSAYPQIKIQESDTDEVLDYTGLVSERKTLEKGILIHLLDTFAASRTMNPKMLEQLNDRYHAQLSYQKQEKRAA